MPLCWLRNDTRKSLWPLFSSGYNLPQQLMSAEGKYLEAQWLFRGKAWFKQICWVHIPRINSHGKIKVHEKRLFSLFFKLTHLLEQRSHFDLSTAQQLATTYVILHLNFAVLSTQSSPKMRLLLQFLIRREAVIL